jgi:DNA-binding NarL/FixJ family response regulator
MASSAVKLHDGAGTPGDGTGENAVRLIVADSQTIFRVGLRKIFAVEDDIRVVGQAETYGQALSAISKFTADVILFEAALAGNPAEAISELLRRAPNSKLIIVTADAHEEETLEFFRRGAHGIVERAVEPETLIDCIHKVGQGELWLDPQAVRWVLKAYRSQTTRPVGPVPNVHLTQKELLIVSCVAQGMKNKEIAQRVNTTEQVVKNYLRKVYDKLGVSDRLELALYCLHHRLLDNSENPSVSAEPTAESEASAIPAEPEKVS